MEPVNKAIWYIESHFEQPISLDDLAAVGGVSRFHMSRAFCYATGLPVSRYLRFRRLSEAACALADGKNDILDLAMTLGYGSHEAFSRAFKECFGMTPEQVRRQGHTRNLNLLEARRMNTASGIKLTEPRIVTRGPLLVAGLARKYAASENAAIPGQWQAFAPSIGHIPGQVSPVTYGVVYNADEDANHEYLCGIEVRDFAHLPERMDRLRIPAMTWAVFTHPGHVSDIQAVCKAIWSEWLPTSGRQAADAPFFERYPEGFDPLTGKGGFEVWLAVQ